MILGSFFVLLNTLALATALPSSEASALQKRNPCDGINAEPDIGKQYGSAECPPINKLDAKGQCGPIEIKTRCIAFCQVRTIFRYGQEVPFSIGRCRGPDVCTITQSDSVAVAGRIDIAPKFVEAFGLGVSGGYTHTTTKGIAIAHQRHLEEGQCGYYTFIPTMKDVCGSVSVRDPMGHYIPGGGVHESCDNEARTYGNICGSQVKRKADGSGDGDTVFVKIDCVTRHPLPMDQQDPIYGHEGVAMPREALLKIMSSWPPGPGEPDKTPPPSKPYTQGGPFIP